MRRLGYDNTTNQTVLAYDDDFHRTHPTNASSAFKNNSFNHNSTQHPSPVLIYHHSHGTSVGVLILVVLLVLLTVLLTILVMNILRHRLMRRLWTARMLQSYNNQQQRSTVEEFSATEKEDRYKVVEAWLISKRVLQHDDACDRILEAAATKKKLDDDNTVDDHPGSLKVSDDSDNDTQSIDSQDVQVLRVTTGMTADDNENECPICMSAFLEGEIVSYSSNKLCSHVYHHECVKEWLLQHKECPFCRETFLEVDKPSSQPRLKSPQQLTKRAQFSYCCLEHGLVEISPDLLVGRRDDDELIADVEQKVKGERTAILKGDLMFQRGGRSTSDDKMDADMKGEEDNTLPDAPAGVDETAWQLQRLEEGEDWRLTLTPMKRTDVIFHSNPSQVIETS